MRRGRKVLSMGALPPNPLRRAPLVLLLGAAACFDRGPPIWAPNPAAAGPPSAACEHARELLARAPALLQAGRVDRAVRVLQRAEDVCAAEAPATWALRVGALAAVGRSAEALQLATRIERSDRAGDADRAAATAARAIATEHGLAVVERGRRHDAPELFDPDEKRRAKSAALLRRGSAASRAGDHVVARALFLEAWAAWHPNPRALVEAGLEARLGGALAEAQALWDRAAYDDATVAIRPELSTGAPSIQAGATLAWSAGGERLAVGGDDEITVFDATLHPTLRVRTGERVLALAFTSAEGLLLAGLDGGVVRVFDAGTGAHVRDLQGHRGPVRAVVAAPDGHTFASAADDGTVELRDAVSGASLHSLRPPRAAAFLAFDATGARLATAGDDRRISLWETSSGALAGTLPARGQVRALAFAGDHLDVVTADARLRWDISQPRRPRPVILARAGAERASLVAGGEHPLVAVTVGPELTVGDFSGASPAEAPGAPASTPGADHGGLAAFALAPTAGALAAVYRDGSVAILPAGAVSTEPRLIARSGPVDALAVAADGKTFAAAAGGRVLIWRTGADRLRADDLGDARALTLSPDGTTLAIGLDRGRIALGDVAGRRPDLFLDAAGAVQCLAFSPDGARLVVGTAAPSVQILAASGESAPHLLPLGAGPVRSVRFSPDGAAVLLASKEGVTLWSPAAREGLRFVPYGPDPRAAAFTPDGAGMVVADQRGEILLGKPTASTPAAAQRVLVAGQVVALAIASDGNIATGEGDRAITLRSPAGKALQRFHDADAAVRAVAFVPGHIAAGLGDGSLRLYRAHVEGPTAVLRAVPGLGARQLAGLVSGPGGHLEIVGPDAVAARAALRCRLGAALYPLEVCAEQFEVAGLLSMVLAGQDPAEAEP